MERGFDNKKRLFADVVTLEAWHEPFETSKQVALHAHVVFDEGRLGGEDDSQVRFRLGIARAEIVVVVPPTEPISVVRATVSRDGAETKGTRIVKADREIGSSISGGVGSSLTPGILTFSASGSAEGKISAKTVEVVELVESIRPISVQQKITAEGYYRWDVSAPINKILIGSPWDPNKEPRLELLDTRSNRNKGIPGAVRVEVRCRREDLRISDVQIKDVNKWKSIVNGKYFRNKQIAAEAFIRDRLTKEGLMFGDISDPFGSLCMADVAAQAERQ